MGKKRLVKALSFSLVISLVMVAYVAIMVSPVLGETPKYGGTLKLIMARTPVSIGYPPLLRGGDVQAVVPCIETLLLFDEMGRSVPYLVTDWKISSDNKSANITLRKGVKFHDGTDLNAEAVKWNFLAHEKEGRGGIPYMTSVDVLDDYTLRINVKKFANDIPYQLTQGPGRVASPTAIEKNGVDWARNNPVGTGPFQFVGFKRGAYIKYKKFDQYWQKGKPYLDKLEFMFIKDPMTASASFQAGEANILIRIFPKTARDLEKKGYKVLHKTSALRTLTPDSVSPDSIYRDKRVREALEYAINRKAITDTLGYGLWESLTQACPSNIYGYNPGLTPRAYDPEKAKRLLAEAGYPNGFETNIIVSTTYANRDAMVAIQRDLQKVGIKAKLDFADMGRWSQHKFKGWKNSIMYMLLGMGPNFHRVFFRQLVTMPQYPNMIRPQEWTDALNKGAVADFDDMKRLTQKAVRIMHEEAMFVPLFGTPSIAVVDSSLRSDFYGIHHIQWTPADAWFDK